MISGGQINTHTYSQPASQVHGQHERRRETQHGKLFSVVHALAAVVYLGNRSPRVSLASFSSLAGNSMQRPVTFKFLLMTLTIGCKRLSNSLADSSHGLAGQFFAQQYGRVGRVCLVPCCAVGVLQTICFRIQYFLMV